MKITLRTTGVFSMLVPSIIAVVLTTSSAAFANIGVPKFEKRYDGDVMFCKEEVYKDPCDRIPFGTGGFTLLWSYPIASTAKSMMMPKMPPGRSPPYWQCQFYEGLSCDGRSRVYRENSPALNMDFVMNSFRCKHF
ncbi:hypothetical protein P154DRAFT_573997 [Amniculicola lignicola CBS 123094]|uniref:Uncharacterized protein n=1 Tax=Amniculicola lignicola CBS 123094 TaxID=1392246 RepID=A0A6A5WXP4_9PLEO|nr:hypothetical protein P154DRAFT_573997 [Amniculicola lignicola CBS 123094]